MPRIKNICMIVQSYYPIDVRIRRQAEALAKKGFAVDIICLRDTNEPKIEVFDRITAYRILNRRSKEKFLQYIVLSVNFFIRAFFKIQLLSFRKTYSLIEVDNMPDFLVFTTVIQKLRGIPVVFDIHDLTVELFTSKWPQKKMIFILLILKYIERLACSFADEIITVSQGCVDRLISRGVQKRITLILNTAGRIFKYDHDRNFRKIYKNAKLIYHGTVAERFGIHILIEAVSIIKKQIPGSCIYIYGAYDESYKKKLVGLVKNLELNDNVFLLGIYSLEEIYKKILDSDVGVVPYLDDEYMQLSLSTKTFEYTASGLPVVASRLYSLSQIFNDSCLKYVTPGNPIELAEKIINLCLNPDLQKSQSKFAYQALTQISGEVMEKRYCELIQSVIGNHHPNNDVHR